MAFLTRSVRGYGAAYLYTVWFVHRHFKSSFTSLSDLSLLQAAMAPGMPIACYFMSIYYFLEVAISRSFPREAAYIFAIIFVSFTILAAWPWMGKQGMLLKFKEFQSISPQRRRLYDVMVWILLLLAIPTALTAAVIARNKFVVGHEKVGR